MERNARFVLKKCSGLMNDICLTISSGDKADGGLQLAMHHCRKSGSVQRELSQLLGITLDVSAEIHDCDGPMSGRKMRYQWRPLHSECHSKNDSREWHERFSASRGNGRVGDPIR